MKLLSNFPQTKAAAVFLLLFSARPLTSAVDFQPSLPKKKIVTETDLPRFTYPVTGSALDLVKADDATFKLFLDRFAADVDSVLAGYEIEDKATLRKLLLDKATAEELRGDVAAAMTTADRRRALIEKPSERAMNDLEEGSFLAAWKRTGSSSGPAFQQAFTRELTFRLDALEWSMVQESIKSENATCKVLTDAMFASTLKELDRDTKSSGGMNYTQASQVVGARWVFRFYLPSLPQLCPVFAAYLKAHDTAKPDIWAARDLVLTSVDKLTPVRVAIWDSGVDTSVYPTQLYTDAHPDTNGPHGLAFDIQGKPFVADLQPLTAEQKAFYPKFLSLNQGFNDLHDGIDSPDAAQTQQFFKSTPPDELAALHKNYTFLGQWSHGTHVAGIAVRDNPAARLVVIQFNDGLRDLPFAPSVEWANRFKLDFQQVGDYLRERDVRVVNMSWSDSVSEIEEWLGTTSTEKDPAIRKRAAEQVYAIWKEAVRGAIERAPNTLFFCAAGNSNSDAGFNGDVPASLHLPNLVTVGAVDQAGDETSFTSYGDTVVLDADGYRVMSFLPGGSQAKLSGTSMPSPNAANLAAKLIALQPSLTPAEVVAIMEKTADTSGDGRLHLINPKLAVAMLRNGTHP